MPPRTGKLFLPCVFAICLLAMMAFYVRGPFGNWLFEKGIEARKEWKLERAINYFGWASYLGSQTDQADFEKAICYQLRGDFIRSRAQFEKLLSNSILNQNLKIRILNANGRNLFNQNESDKALESHRESLRLARLINNKKLEAAALVGLSRVLYHTQGEFDQAKINLEKALAIGREINDELIIADALRNIGVVIWWGKGELDRPLEQYYQPALAIYRKNGELQSEAMMLANISHIHSFKGDRFKNLKFLNQSLAIREKIGDQAGLSESYRALGQIYFNARNLRKGREYLLRSLALSKKIGFQLNQNEVETYLAGVYTLLGEYDEAILLFRKIIEREKDNPGLVNARLGSIAYCYLLKGDFEEARRIFEQLLEREKANDLKNIRAVAALYTYLGNTYLKLGELDKAEEMLAGAKDMHLKHGDGRIQGHFSYHLPQAEFKFIKGDSEKSFQFLKDAADDELDMFAASGTKVVTHPPLRDYNFLFSFLLEKLNKQKVFIKGENNRAEELAFRFLEQRRYRSFRNFIVQSSSKNITSTLASVEEKKALSEIETIKDQLKTKNDPELKKRLQRAYGNYENAVLREQFSSEIQRAIAFVKPVDLATTKENLNKDTALIEYILADEKVFALVVTKEGLRSFLLPVTTANLKNKTRLFQSAIFEKGKDTEDNDWLPIAKSLYESLIKPLEESGVLENKDRLAIIPFGFLHDLPFAALVREKSFLVEDYILYFPPSASFLNVNKNTFKNKNLVSFGINSTVHSNLPPLKFAVEESRTVAKIFSGKARLEIEADETSLKNIAPKVSHLHIATHALAEAEMPLFSRLILESSETDDGNLTTREIFEMGLNADLITIAACEGAKSFSSDFEGLIDIDRIGLTEAFLHAGSKSVLASLSPASDRATIDLMKDFYTNLLEKDKAESLAISQRRMLNNGNFTHPKYWANFVLIGNDR